MAIFELAESIKVYDDWLGNGAHKSLGRGGLYEKPTLL